MAEIYNENSSYSKRPLWQWIAIYIVIAAVIYGAVYYFLNMRGGSNVGYNYSTSPSPLAVITSPSPTPEPSVSPSSSPSASSLSEVTLILNQENSSGQSGTATLQESSGQTTVTLNISGEPTGFSEPAHIHIGNCPGVGAVKYPLKDVVNGKSVTVIPVTLATLKTLEPLAINVHKSAAAINIYTSCGQLNIK